MLNTAINALDELVSLKNKELITIASRPGIGKSTLLLNIVNSVSKQTNNKILYFNFENSKNSLLKKIKNNNIEIIDTPNLSILDIENIIKTYKKEDIALVAIDYLQLINMKNEVSEISRELKSLALELNIPVVLISQLSSNSKDIPTLIDLRKNGTLVQDSDVIIFLYNKESKLNENIDLIVAKNRGGSLGTIKIDM
jgi:strongly similar to replicative DNA helicase